MIMDNVFSNKDFERPVKVVKLKSSVRWYQDLPEMDRIRAVDNAVRSGNILNETGCLYDALVEGFGFEDSPEGADYWLNIVDNL